ncbi:MAG: isocitrate lyase/PEP mutase family protein [Sedimentibacter sp.]|uniref:isocitrate lyase/PEP mutase family protein n=1 Tax=Sedimentibacter sp. TaxID=1960295 RepID=UPI0031586326
MTAAKKLREMLSQNKIIVAPGAYDAWSAKLISKSGFQAVYMTGYGVSASVLGKPDIGLITLTEMVAAAKNIVDAAGDTPVIADADNGYGGNLNVMRTVQEYERAGVAAIQLEDQVTPKRCGHMEGKEIISKEEMVAKIKAAVSARKDPDLCIIARTDARAVNGFEDALERAKIYEEAGADIIFIEAPQSVDEMKKVAQCIKSPLLANMVEKGKTPMLKNNELENIGYKIAIYPVSPLYAATKAVIDILSSMKENDTSLSSLDKIVDFPTFNSMIDLQELRELEKSFL